MEKVEIEKPMKWLRSRNVIEMLGISESTLQTFRINGTLPAYKLGKMWLYREDEIISILFANRVN